MGFASTDKVSAIATLYHYFEILPDEVHSWSFYIIKNHLCIFNLNKMQFFTVNSYEFI